MILWGSRDIEDILNLFDGRTELVLEIQQANADVQEFIAAQLQPLLSHPDFDYVVQSAANGNADREALLFSRIEAVGKTI